MASCRHKTPWAIGRAVTLAASLALLGGSTGCNRDLHPPATEAHSVQEAYHGVTVEDPYRWLTDASDPKVQAWAREQNAYTRHYLDNLQYLAPVRKQVSAILSKQSVIYFEPVFRTHLFMMKLQPPRNQPMIVLLPAGADTTGEHVVVDPNAIDTSGNLAIDWFVPSHDGRFVAASLSRNGSEDGTVHVFDVQSGRALSDTLPRVQYPTGGGSLEWNAGNTGFYYTRYPQGDERPPADINFYQQVFFHRLGTPVTRDTYAVGREFPRIAETALTSTRDGRYVLASVANGDGGEFEQYLLDPAGVWKKIAAFSDSIVAAQFGPDNRLYLLSRSKAPSGTIIRVSPEHPDLAGAAVIVPPDLGGIKEFAVTDHMLFVVDVVGGPSRMRLFDLVGKQLPSPILDSIALIGGLCPLGGDRLLFGLQSYLHSRTRFEYSPSLQTLRATNLSSVQTVDFSDCEVRRIMATSKDGTSIPMTLVQRRGTKRDGTSPTILYGYGGYGVNMEPSFDPLLRIWLDQGGTYAVATIRGGGEFGDAWHRAGMLTRKQNVFDDFLACAHHLVDQHYTSREKLAIMGGSNGGLLMGAALTQEPDLFRAVVSYAGIYDMLQVEQFPNGQFNVPEYGSIKDSAQFAAMYAYSPYQHVHNNVAYPAVLFLAGDNDGRVDPANSRKMTAILQASTTSGRGIYLRTDALTGHGFGTGLSAEAAEQADVYSFLFDQLKVTYQPPK